MTEPLDISAKSTNPEIPVIKAKSLPNQLNERIKSTIVTAYAYQKEGHSLLHKNLTARWAFQRMWGDDNRTLKKVRQSTESQQTLDPKTVQENAKKVVAILKKGFGKDIDKPEMKAVVEEVRVLETLLAKTESIEGAPKSASLKKHRIIPQKTKPVSKTGLLLGGLLLLAGLAAASSANVSQALPSLNVDATTQGGILTSYRTQATMNAWNVTHPLIKDNFTRLAEVSEEDAQKSEKQSTEALIEQIDSALKEEKPEVVLERLNTVTDPKIRQEAINYIYKSLYRETPEAQLTYVRSNRNQLNYFSSQWEVIRKLIINKQFPETFPPEMIKNALWYADLDIVEILADKTPITARCIEELAFRFDETEDQFDYYLDRYPNASQIDYHQRLEKIAEVLLKKFDQQKLPPSPTTKKTSTMTASQKYHTLFHPSQGLKDDSALGLQLANLNAQGTPLKLSKTSVPEEHALQEEVADAIKNGIQLERIGGHDALKNKEGKRIGMLRPWQDRMAYEVDHHHFAGVPPIIPLTLPGRETEYIQKWVDNGVLALELDRNLPDTQQLQAIEILDMRFGNKDRRLGNNIIVTKVQDQTFLVPIDHDWMPSTDYRYTRQPDAPQFNLPFTKECQDYIVSLNIEEDAKILEKWMDQRFSSSIKEQMIRGMKMRTTILKMGIEKELKVKHFMHLFAIYQEEWDKIVAKLPVQTVETIRTALQPEFDKACKIVTDRIQRMKIAVKAWKKLDFRKPPAGPLDSHLP